MPPRDPPALRRLSAQIGRDPTLTQGPGGNSSIKDKGTLWVKASGTWMAAAERDDIFLLFDLAVIRRQLAAGADDCATGVALNPHAAQASIEAPVHAILPHRVIGHFHCVETQRWAVLADGERDVAQRLGRLA